MIKKGRPVKITKNTVASKCLELYWKNGIKNVSYNDAVKYSGCSKGTIYKLFKSEDELHLNTLKFYNEKYLNSFEKELIKKNDIFDFIEFYFTTAKSDCYFIISNSYKYLLGKLSNNYLLKTEKIIIKLLANLIVRHVNEYKLNPTNLDALSLATYLINNFTLINIMLTNKAKNKDYMVIKAAMKDYLANSLHGKSFSLV